MPPRDPMPPAPPHLALPAARWGAPELPAEPQEEKPEGPAGFWYSLKMTPGPEATS